MRLIHVEKNSEVVRPDLHDVVTYLRTLIRWTSTIVLHPPIVVPLYSKTR